MRKIKTIFERNWTGDGKITKNTIHEIALYPFILDKGIATEKIDGTNVRITVRNHIAARVEKRRNPDAIQKKKGMIDPWYTDADESDPQDKYIYNGLRNTPLADIPDGEWSGELVGPNVQGNSLNLEENRIVFFTLGQCPVFEDVPTEYEDLKEWLPKQKSKIGRDCGIEGIVWHMPDGSMYKIKTKDFYDRR